jgi:hypothetical protein
MAVVDKAGRQAGRSRKEDTYKDASPLLPPVSSALRRYLKRVDGRKDCMKEGLYEGRAV